MYAGMFEVFGKKGRISLNHDRSCECNDIKMTFSLNNLYPLLSVLIFIDILEHILFY